MLIREVPSGQIENTKPTIVTAKQEVEDGLQTKYAQKVPADA
jgi:hypothetical protein